MANQHFGFLTPVSSSKDRLSISKYPFLFAPFQWITYSIITRATGLSHIHLSWAFPHSFGLFRCPYSFASCAHLCHIFLLSGQMFRSSSRHETSNLVCGKWFCHWEVQSLEVWFNWNTYHQVVRSSQTVHQGMYPGTTKWAIQRDIHKSISAFASVCTGGCRRSLLLELSYILINQRPLCSSVETPILYFIDSFRWSWLALAVLQGSVWRRNAIWIDKMCGLVVWWLEGIVNWAISAPSSHIFSFMWSHHMMPYATHHLLLQIAVS